MSRVLRSATKKIQTKDDLSSKLSISKKSRTIKRRVKEVVVVKNKNSQQNDIWNISSVLSKIFAYSDHKDLLEFNTVSKKWNHASNPIIHKTIKLNRSWDINNSYYGIPNIHGKIDADIAECITNNAKHAHHIKYFYYNYKVEPQRAIEVFETFRFINKLTIHSLEMSQDQFLGMISPLTQLQDLTLQDLRIKKIIYRRFYKEVVQLPSSLKKLRMDYIILIGNPELFIQTINSHKNLTEFSSKVFHDFGSLEPFYKPYPSLVKFEYKNQELQSNKSLVNILEQNHQITSLKLELKCWNSELGNYINSYLTNLEEFSFDDIYFGYNHEKIDLKFSQPTKIKKLNLNWFRLTDCSLNSIFQNCPHLEELELDRYTNSYRPGSELFINLSNTVKVKKLTINCQNFGVPIFDTFLSRFLNLTELVVILPKGWKEAMKSICENCTNLQKLDITPHDQLYARERNAFFEEFYKTELFTSTPKCKSTLTNLTLNQFLVADSKAENFKNFENLKSIKYLNQFQNNYNIPSEKRHINMDLWPGYKLLKTDKNGHFNSIELKKVRS